MNEVELKFQIPAQAQADVARAAADSVTVSRTRLQAQYYDTDDRLLARSGFALRLRKEGAEWVQTLKGRGDGLMQRLEHNASVQPSGDADPVLDLGRHAATPAGAALLALLARSDRSAEALQLQYRTDLLRTHRQLRQTGVVVELAHDVGVIAAAGASLAVNELEFELLRGSPQGLLDIAHRWVRRHGLWLDVRTKAERGDRLARGLVNGTPVHARALVLKADMSPAAAFRAMVASSLEQVLANASELADGLGEPEHLHQLRVGLRRLRTVLREFGALQGRTDAASAAALAELEAGLAELFSRLGTARDRDALEETWLPALRATGGPALQLPAPEDAPDLGELLRTRSVQGLWLALIRLAQEPLPATVASTVVATGSVDRADTARDAVLPPAAGAGADLEPLLRECIRRQHRRLLKDCSHFATLAPEARHRVRKRLKRLRYSVELVAGLYPAKAVERYLTALRPAQDALGRLNDLRVAAEQFEILLPVEPQAWYALGWLAAQQAPALAACTEALAALPEAPRFWRKRR